MVLAKGGILRRLQQAVKNGVLCFYWLGGPFLGFALSEGGPNAGANLFQCGHMLFKVLEAFQG